MKLSIIVPCYNSERFIAKTMDSLLKQSYQDFKVIAIDDGSSDNTLDILKEYAQKDARVQVYHKKNGGIASARNYGLSLVDTDYFGFLDSDDYVKDDWLKAMMQKIEEDQSDLVVCGFTWTYTYAKKKDYVTLEGPYKPKQEMMLQLFATLWNKIYRTQFVKDTGLTFPDGYRYEDASFLYRLVPFVSKVSFLEEPYIFYVQHPASITHTHNEKVKDMIHVFEDILEFYHQKKFYEEYKQELEYIFIRFFLGNSFLRSVQIKDKQDRKLTLDLSFKILQDNFPNWKKNYYLNHLGGLKNIYYKLVNRYNYWVFASIFTCLKRK